MDVTVATVLRVDPSKCCFCIPYRAGVIAIAVLTLIESIGDIVYGCFAVGAVRCHGIPACIGILMIWFGATSIVQGLISLVMAILLLVGVLKSIPSLLIAYMIGMIVNAAFYFGIGVAMLTEVDRYFWNNYAYYGAWFVIWSPLICFFVSVVRVYRFEMIRPPESSHLPEFMSPGNEPQPDGVVNTSFQEDPLNAELGEYPMTPQLPSGTDQFYWNNQDPNSPQSLGTDTTLGTYQRTESFEPANEQSGITMPEINEQPGNHTLSVTEKQDALFSHMLPASDQQPVDDTSPEINSQPQTYFHSMITQAPGSYTPLESNHQPGIITPPFQNPPSGINIPPAINQQPGNDKQPESSHQLVTNMPPMTNQQPETYGPPVTMQQPENYTQPVINQQPQTNLAPITNLQPASYTSPVTTQQTGKYTQHVINHQPGTNMPPITNQQSGTSLTQVTNQQPDNTKELTFAPQPHINNQLGLHRGDNSKQPHSQMLGSYAQPVNNLDPRQNSQHVRDDSRTANSLDLRENVKPGYRQPLGGNAQPVHYPDSSGNMNHGYQQPLRDNSMSIQHTDTHRNIQPAVRQSFGGTAQPVHRPDFLGNLQPGYRQPPGGNSQPVYHSDPRSQLLPGYPQPHRGKPQPVRHPDPRVNMQPGYRRPVGENIQPVNLRYSRSNLPSRRGSAGGDNTRLANQRYSRSNSPLGHGAANHLAIIHDHRISRANISL